MNSKSVQLIIAACTAGRFQYNEEAMRVLRRYFNNAGMYDRSFSNEVQALFTSNPEGWPLTEEFNLASIAWLKNLLLRRSDGMPRRTVIARRLTEQDIAIVQDLASFRFMRMHIELDPYWVARNPGHEKATCYPIFRALPENPALGHMDYYQVPWQASVDPTETGLFPVRG